MSSTFGSLNIAKTGLQYQQIAIDTANNNIANVNTEGYVRRRAVAAEVGGPDQPVVWSTYDGHGQGVATQAVQRLSDVLTGNRVRKEHANLSYLQVQQQSMERVEAGINEPTDQAVSQAITDFNKSWQDVNNAPDGEAARRSVISAGQTLASAINTQARNVDSEIGQQRSGVAQNVEDVNRDAQQLARLNHSIFLAQANGSDVSDLADQRDQVALDLANKAGAIVTVGADGRYTATITDATGVSVDLVTMDQYGDRALTLQANDAESAGAPGSANLTFSVGDPKTGTDTTLSGLSGELGGQEYLLNYSLKSYRSQLDDLATKLSTVVNAQHAAGYDASGTSGGDFFSTDPDDPAGSMAVAIAGHPELVAVSAGKNTVAGVVQADHDATNADAISQVLLGRATTAVPAGSNVNINDVYQSMVAGLGSTVAGLNSQTSNQQLLTTQVDDENEQTAGVSLDEETINLMAAQRAYQASSRVLSVMDTILDTLINHTGV